MTDYLSHETSKLIHTLAATENANPFFITLTYFAPHNPLQALRSDYDDPALANVTSHTERVYLAMIKALDRGVGTVLQALKDTDNWENTIVIFTSDNGGAGYIDIDNVNYPYRGWKATFFEGGVRVPFFMQWPKMIPAGLQVEETVSHLDIYPTVAAAASLFEGSSTEDQEIGEECNANISGECDVSSLSKKAISQPPLDGINLLPYITTGADSDIHANNLTDRLLFWRSGDYKAIIYHRW